MGTDKLRVSEVAGVLGISQNAVRDLIKRGHFPGAHKIDPTRKSVYLIPRQDLEKFLRRQQGEIVEDN